MSDERDDAAAPAKEPDLREQVEAFLDDVARMKESIADVDVPGWIIGRPTISELTGDLAIMVARSKPGDPIPFILPYSAEASIAVLEGSVQVTTGKSSIIIGRSFFVLGPGADRSILPLEHPSRIYVTFFRARVSGDDGFEVDC